MSSITSGFFADPVAKKLLGPAFSKQSNTLEKNGDKYRGTAVITHFEADVKIFATVPVNSTLVLLVTHTSIVAYRVTLETHRQTPIVPAP